MKPTQRSQAANDIDETEPSKGDSTESPTPEQLFESIAPAVLQIEMKGSDGKTLGSGTGFFIDDQGTLVTNAHVALAEGTSFLVITSADETAFFVDEVAAFDRDMDLAILKTGATRCRYLPLLEEPPKVGSRVYAIGNPAGLRHTFSDGLVSGVRPIDDKHQIVQTTAAISPGSSGGPLVDDRGRVIGVTTLYLKVGQNLNFAVPVSALRELLTSTAEPVKLASLTPDLGDSATPASHTVETNSSRVYYLSEADTLVALRGVYVLVEDLKSDVRAAGVNESDVRSLMERRMRRAGITVLTEAERLADPRCPILYAIVSSISTSDLSTYGIVVNLRLQQYVDLVTSSSEERVSLRVLATTWHAPAIYGSVGRLRLFESIEDSLGKQLDEFVRDYAAAQHTQ